MAIDDHYATLRVTPDADGAVIRSAYRGLMRRYHPDVNGSDGAVARAKAINEAYACLRDPSKRALYDRERAAATMPPPRRSSYYPPPPPPPSGPDMAWSVAETGGWRRPRWGRPTWWQAIGLAGASIVTVVTFSATSATPPFAAPADVRAIVYFRSVQPIPPKPERARPSDRNTPARR